MRRVSAVLLALALGAALSRASLADDADEERLALEIRAATGRATKAIATAMKTPMVGAFPSAFSFVHKNDQVRTLAALTLLRAGNAAEKKIARELLDSWWRDETSPGAGFSNTGNYELALGISALEGLTLERIDDAHPRTLTRYEARPVSETDRQRLEEATRALMDGASLTYTGGIAWSYMSLPITTEPEAPRPAQPKTKELPALGRRPRPRPRDGSFDNSNTQFSVLALHDAARGGVTIPAEVSAGIAEHFLGCAGASSATGKTATNGPMRWGYTTADADGTAFKDPTPTLRHSTMNFAGLSSLAIARDLGARDARIDRAIERGLEGIAEFFLCFHGKIPDAGEGGGGTAYALYSLEKAFDSLDLKALDGHDWFAPIAREVLKKQAHTGLWGSGDVIDSCLYTLFLTRATISKGRVLDRRSTGVAANKSSSGEVYLPRTKKTVNALTLLGDYSREGNAAARLAADEAVHALAAEGHGHDACLLAPIGALLGHKDARREDAARWLHDLCGRAVTQDEARAAATRFDAIAETRDPALLRPLLVDATSLLPLRTFAANALVTAPGADAGCVIAAAEALAGDPVLGTAAGSRCARTYADVLTGLLCAALPPLSQDKPVLEADLRAVVNEARTKIRKAQEGEIERALAVYAKRDADPAAWKAAREKLQAGGKDVLAGLVGMAADPTRAAACFTLLRALTGELIPDDLPSWKGYVDSRP